MRLVAVIVVLASSIAHGEEQRPVPALEQSLPRPAAWRELAAVKRDIVAALDKGLTPLVIFDLDETVIISDRGMHWDPKMRVIPGAIDYIQELINTGAKIVYLTGRKTKFEKPTIAELNRLKLPMGPSVTLVMNPTPHRGYVFKKWYRPQLLAMGTPIAFFENEKDNVRLFRRDYPWARVLRVNTRAKYPDIGRGSRGISVIDDFRRVRDLRTRHLRDDRARLRAQTRRR